jgi:hypothetical protein
MLSRLLGKRVSTPSQVERSAVVSEYFSLPLQGRLQVELAPTEQ